VQSNTAYQPRIVNAGVIDRDGTNNRPAPYFDGSNDVMTIDYALAATTETAYDAGTTYAVGDVVSSGGYVYIAIASTTGNAPTDTTKWRQMTTYERRNLDITTYPFMINAVVNNNAQAGYVLSRTEDAANESQYAVFSFATPAIDIIVNGVDRVSDGTYTANKQTVTSTLVESGSQKIYINGTQVGGTGSYNGAITSRVNMSIGARPNNVAGTAWTSFWKGYLPELIITLNPSARSKIENNQDIYYKPAK
jgi:hypothetical protein